ncbi:P-loop NTPase fold protein [Rouxiella silvae]
MSESIKQIEPFSNGFTPEDDIFNRKPFYDQVMRVIKHAPEEQLVLALDDNWGNGKTTFVEMMKSQIEKDESEHFNVVYFNSFESDYSTDPFIALTAEIYALIKRDENTLKSFGRKFLDVSTKVGAALLSSGVKVVINAATAGLADGGNIAKIGKEVIDKATESTEAYIENKITSLGEEKKDIEYFKTTLEEIHTESKKKTIFIIDELDRARPDYSLDLLEKVKHLFSVRGVIFYLVMNRSQFEKSIEQRYGQIDSRTYLNKFVNYWTNLPKIKADPYKENHYTHTTITTYLRKINEQHKLLSFNGIFINCLSYLLDINNCSLREADRCYSMFRILSGSENVSQFSEAHQTTLAITVFLKVKNNDILEKFIIKTLNQEQLYHTLNLAKSSSYTNPNMDIIDHYITYHYLDDEKLKEDEIIKKYGEFLSRGRWQKPFNDFYSCIQNLVIS